MHCAPGAGKLELPGGGGACRRVRAVPGLGWSGIAASAKRSATAAAAVAAPSARARVRPSRAIAGPWRSASRRCAGTCVPRHEPGHCPRDPEAPDRRGGGRARQQVDRAAPARDHGDAEGHRHREGAAGELLARRVQRPRCPGADGPPPLAAHLRSHHDPGPRHRPSARGRRRTARPQAGLRQLHPRERQPRPPGWRALAVARPARRPPRAARGAAPVRGSGRARARRRADRPGQPGRGQRRGAGHRQGRERQGAAPGGRHRDPSHDHAGHGRGRIRARRGPDGARRRIAHRERPDRCAAPAGGYDGRRRPASSRATIRRAS